ncbi:MAG: hypothetical protein DMG91_16870 [Acidobacteria bacterium]|nr:MAG: hypothetical protein DMG91_16870 [Acidobacteriota bacterium]
MAAPAPLPMLPALPVCELVPDAEALESPIEELLEALALGEVPALPMAWPVTSTCWPTWVRS